MARDRQHGCLSQQHPRYAGDRLVGQRQRRDRVRTRRQGLFDPERRRLCPHRPQLPHQSPGGVYCDVFHGDYSAGQCTGPTYTVDSAGWFKADIAPQDGLALHSAAKLS
ncbi:alpha amylase C-terminal domain-containing protein [Kribbella pittospori]|uniref:alpha amylase C-terminal domain-containing protein n=1 Tax=Kribbella pittospori TaxID=722689 RepID=UPI003B5010F7